MPNVIATCRPMVGDTHTTEIPVNMAVWLVSKDGRSAFMVAGICPEHPLDLMITEGDSATPAGRDVWRSLDSWLREGDIDLITVPDLTTLDHDAVLGFLKDRAAFRTIVTV